MVSFLGRSRSVIAWKSRKRKICSLIKSTIRVLPMWINSSLTAIKLISKTFRFRIIFISHTFYMFPYMQLDVLPLNVRIGFVPGFIAELSGVIIYICHLHIIFPIPQDPSYVGSILELKMSLFIAIEMASHLFLPKK